MTSRVKICITIFAALVFSACVKSVLMPQSDLPNSDFEGWTTDDQLQQWKTNSCPECVPAYNTYIVQKTTEAYHGQYAAKLVYNGVYPAIASTSLAVTNHPKQLTGYAKCTLYDQDTAYVKINVFSGGAMVDSGKWVSTTSISDYQKFTIPLTQSSTHADSVIISIKGGHVSNSDGTSSTLWVDYFCLR